MQLVSTLLAIVGLIREVWGLFRDIKKKDPDFQSTMMAKRLTGAVKAYREDQGNAAEIKALVSLVGDRLTGQSEEV